MSRGNGNAGKIYTHTEPPDGTEAYKIGDQAIDDQAVQCNTDGSCDAPQGLAGLPRQCVSCRGKLTQQTPNARGGKNCPDNDNGYRYYQTMIMSFRCRETERIFKGKFSATLPQAIQKAAARKLEIIDAARDLDDLRTPPGNRLEALSGDRRGQHSIRINEQWRVCFVWQDGNANDVEIVEYH